MGIVLCKQSIIYCFLINVLFLLPIINSKEKLTKLHNIFFYKTYNINSIY